MLGNAVIPLFGSGIGSILVAGTLYLRESRPIVLAWLLLVYATLGIRIALTWHYRRRLALRGYVPRDAMFFSLTVGLSGIAWGLGGLLIQGTDVPSAVLVITGIQAMVMGGAVTLGAFMPAFLSFSAPAILPMAGALAWSGSLAEAVTALYSIIFFGLMILIAHRFNRSLHQTWQLTYEKEDLVGALTEASDKLTQMARTDGLTELANRSRFDQMLEIEYARLARSGAPLSLVLLDVDHFKLFNDTYGHVAGDVCLKQVARIFKEAFHRVTDLPARYGGEEFIGLLPETGSEGARALAESIRARIAGLAIPHSASKTAPHVTASLGVVTLDCSALASPGEAIALADRLLYEAKARGRNRVEHLPLPDETEPAYSGG
jgi:diguanylate cyclase (GGDEF)-like protein